MSDTIKAAHIIAEAINWVGWALIWAAFIVGISLPSTPKDLTIEVKKDGQS
jgi:hypothetical protein